MSNTGSADRRSPTARRGVSWPQPRPKVLLRFWSMWLVVLVVALIVTAVCASDGLGYPLVLVPFPTLLVAALVIPWLTPWLSVEAAWVTLVATSWAVMIAGLAWFGIGFAAGFTTFLYGVVIRGLLALYFRRRNVSVPPAKLKA